MIIGENTVTPTVIVDPVEPEELAVPEPLVGGDPSTWTPTETVDPNEPET